MKLACELPDEARRSLSLWTCSELARTLKTEGVTSEISPQSVQRILESHKLKPWRVHFWLSPKAARDEAFRTIVLAILELYTRPLGPDERVLSLDEKTSLQPRTRTVATRPAQPGLVPVRLEHEYARKGALQLFAAFDTRTGAVTAILRRRKRQAEFIELLEKIDRETPETVTLEQWFSILQRKRLSAPNFADLEALEERILAFISEWNDVAHPFAWTARSFDKILAKIDAALPMAA